MYRRSKRSTRPSQHLYGHSHTYPESFPQSQANPEAWIYPIESLGEFRRWLDTDYLPNKYPTYLKTKVKQGLLPPSTAALILAAVVGEDEEENDPDA